MLRTARTWLTTLGALALVIGVAAPAAAVRTREDAADDYETYRTAIDAPRDSIDISRIDVVLGAARHTRPGDSEPGTRITFHIENLRTVAQSKRYLQRFVVVFRDRKDNPTVVVIQRGKKVRIAGADRTCENDSSVVFKDDLNTVKAFIDWDCVGHADFSVKPFTNLRQVDTGHLLARDTVNRFGR